MTDYATLIDEETWAFIRKTQGSYPDDTTHFTIADQRRVYDAMWATFRSRTPPA